MNLKFQLIIVFSFLSTVQFSISMQRRPKILSLVPRVFRTNGISKTRVINPGIKRSLRRSYASVSIGNSWNKDQKRKDKNQNNKEESQKKAQRLFTWKKGAVIGTVGALGYGSYKLKEWRDEDGNTLLIKLVKEGRSNRFLLRSLTLVFDINVQNSFGDTALICAAKNGNIQAVKTLISLLANPNLQNRVGKTALTEATMRQDTQMVKAILSHPATDPNIQDKLGNTALMEAISLELFYESLRMVKAILSHPDTDPNRASSIGRTPLMQAARCGNIKVVKAILSHRDIRPKLCNKFGNNALMEAAEFGNECAVKALLPYVDPNVKNNKGNTALMIAVLNGHYEAVRMLLIDDRIHIGPARYLARNEGRYDIESLIEDAQTYRVYRLGLGL